MMYLWKCTCADCGREFDWYDNYPPLECVKCESVEIKNEFKGRVYD